ncbi:SCO family protein [Kaistia nematophila]|uniref:SCO family protein n=1 Tax=Kaistia nematophila TaxID=2994654 RepID=A0A9X3DY67_9HYPH|nr:SCO family protein [Kaistia nematophila]MCX5567897.1 SCO family protein [Kaistia nematophila]
MRPRHIGLLVGGAFAIVLTLVGFTALVKSRQSTPAGQVVTGVASIGGPFTLTRSDGKAVTERDFLGKPTAIFFGFTFCPEVCPTTLYELSGLIKELGPEAEKMNFVFVSVDWGRDGPKEMASYLSAFDGRIQGLSGTEAEIETVTKAYRVYYKRVPVEGGDYTIDHTASVYLMDGKGQFIGTLAYGEARDTMLEKLKRLVAGA